jgi:hypothetical protein
MLELVRLNQLRIKTQRACAAVAESAKDAPERAPKIF